MAPKFGTSGLRGLVTELTPELIVNYVRAFIAACDIGETLSVGYDLRPSSPDIAVQVVAAAQAEGLSVVDCGALPTPALALAAASVGGGAIMITGSHIPADRNGLKFYSSRGEITKADESAILSHLDREGAGRSGKVTSDDEAAKRFVRRYVDAFGPRALAGRRIGLYSHSAVGRDDLAAMLTGLGADVIELERSESFIPVDTEAVDADTRARITTWVEDLHLDALVSTDGDSDRPLLADETGTIIPGDVMGQITAQVLGADNVVTPVSSNSGVRQKGFERVVTTRIGSPFVIAGMEETGGRVVGYEANGGFLLGFEADGPSGKIPPLMTRDCMLPIIVALVAAGKGTLSARVSQEPRVFTMADRLQDVPQEVSQPFVEILAADRSARAQFLAGLGATERDLNLLDGVRMSLEDGRTVHIRPSGNAPELRLYVEGTDRENAAALLSDGLALLRSRLTQPN